MKRRQHGLRMYALSEIAPILPPNPSLFNYIYAADTKGYHNALLSLMGRRWPYSCWPPPPPQKINTPHEYRQSCALSQAYQPPIQYFIGRSRQPFSYRTGFDENLSGRAIRRYRRGRSQLPSAATSTHRTRHQPSPRSTPPAGSKPDTAHCCASTSASAPEVPRRCGTSAADH